MIEYKPLTPEEYQRMLAEQQASYSWSRAQSEAWVAYMLKTKLEEDSDGTAMEDVT